MTGPIRDAAVGVVIEGATPGIYLYPSAEAGSAAWTAAAAVALTRTIRLIALVAMLAASDTPTSFAAEAMNGKAVFDARCGFCHSATAAMGSAVAGPNLFGIMGRKAATVEGFSLYTPALKNSGITWNETIMAEFLANPMSKVPGTTMVIAVPDPEERADVIAYLKTLTQ